MTRKILVLLPLIALLAACPKRTTRTLPEYQLGPEHAYLGGRVVDLYEHQVVNRRDFVYSIAFDPSSTLVGFPHMVQTDFGLSLADVESGEVRWSAQLNSTEYDAEGVSFVPPDAVVVAARRSGTSSHPTLRLFALEGGVERAAAYGDDERGMVQVVTRGGDGLIATVTAREGNAVLYHPTALVWAGEVRAHRGTATSAVFAPDGTLLTGGQDKTVARWRITPTEALTAGTVRLALIVLGEQRQRAIRAAIAGRHPALLAVETGLSTTAITRAMAEQAGLPLDGAKRKLVTSAGEIEVTAVTLPSLLFKNVETGPIEAVVCDECVPIGADGALGKDLAPMLRVEEGPLPHVLSVEVSAPSSTPDAPADPSTPAAPAPVPTPGGEAPQDGTAGDVAEAAPQLLKLELIKRYVLPGAVNDLRLSRDGKTLCVALSEQPAERTLELYEREKAGDYPEPSQANAAALIDLESGEVRRRFPGHRGYVVSADLSPDGRTLVSGGWDNHVMLFDVESGAMIKDLELAWLTRRVRFSPDGRTLAVAAWTPPNSGGGDSEPAAILYDLVYESPVPGK